MNKGKNNRKPLLLRSIEKIKLPSFVVLNSREQQHSHQNTSPSWKYHSRSPKHSDFLYYSHISPCTYPEGVTLFSQWSLFFISSWISPELHSSSCLFALHFLCFRFLETFISPKSLICSDLGLFFHVVLCAGRELTYSITYINRMLHIPRKMAI